MLQRTFENDRPDENWSIPTHVKGRNDTRQEPQGVPPAPLPSRFTDWSSLGSPHVRTSPHSIPNREVEQGASQPDQWTIQSGSVPNREKAVRDHSQEDVIIPPRICQQLEEQSAQVIEMEPNPLNIKARNQSDDIRADRESNVQVTQPPINVIPLTGLSDQIQVLNVNTSVSENNSETLRGSHVKSEGLGIQENLVIPQVDGPSSILSRNQRVISETVRIGQNYSHEGINLQGNSTSNRTEYPGDSSDDNRSYRG